MNMAVILYVILRLSAEPGIGTDLHPFLANMCRPDGTYFDGV